MYACLFVFVCLCSCLLLCLFVCLFVLQLLLCCVCLLRSGLLDLVVSLFGCFVCLFVGWSGRSWDAEGKRKTSDGLLYVLIVLLNVLVACLVCWSADV